MEEQDIKEIIEIIAEKIRGKNVIWMLAGSTNLKVQGVKTSVRDVDITTNEEGIKLFKNALQDFGVEESFNEKTRAQTLDCTINGFEVEIQTYNDERSMLDKVNIISWNDVEVPVLPLKHAKTFYEIIGRKEKVDMVSRHLNQ